MVKYPRTQHIQGSRLQHGDYDLEDVPFEIIKQKHLVIEEKVDGSQAGISFDNDRLVLQSRGHELRGGPRERQFNLFKSWAASIQDVLYSILDNRYIMYGEWLYAKHSEFYDFLPHYFMEFDILDKESKTFLSTPKRHQMLKGSGVVSVPVISEGEFSKLEHMTDCVRPSCYKSPDWLVSLKSRCEEYNLDFDSVSKETDMSDMSEGLYIKEEDKDTVVGRYKFVRSDFINTIIESGTHWHDRPILPNKLADGIDLFA